MSSDALPISPARFASALRDLPLSTLHLKAAELRNSIAHLDYSNEQLKPFAEGTEPGSTGPDNDCVEAIRENEVVIKRMDERIQLLRNEVEARGSSWNEFLSAEEVAKLGAQEGEGGLVNGTTNGSGREDEEMGEGRSEAWSDGTFQTGRIVGGELRMDGGHGNGVIGSGVNGTGTANGAPVTNGGGRLDDEALRRAMEDRMRALTEEEDEGMHL